MLACRVLVVIKSPFKSRSGTSFRKEGDPVTSISLPCALLQMQTAYDEYNAQAQAAGGSRGHFMVDLCRPGHLTACLRNFQEVTGCRDDSWDAQFGV